MAKFRHSTIEKNSILMVVLTLIVVSIGGLVEIVPLYYLKSTIETVRGMRPYTPLELAGRNIYIREGCYVCHSQMIRPFRDEVERYGPPFSRASMPILRVIDELGQPAQAPWRTTSTTPSRKPAKFTSPPSDST